MIQVLAECSEVSQLFQVELKDNSPSNRNHILLLEINVKPRSFEGKRCLLVVARDVSHVLRHDQLKNEYD